MTGRWRPPSPWRLQSSAPSLGCTDIRQAFTLIELVVVMAIFGIIAAVVVPAFLRAAAPNNALAAAEPIVQVLKAAQQAAAKNDVPVTVLIDPATAAYRAAAEDEDTVLAEGTFALSNDTRLQADSLRARFVFEPTGGVAGDSLFVISSAGTVLLRPDPWGGTVDVVQ